MTTTLAFACFFRWHLRPTDRMVTSDSPTHRLVRQFVATSRPLLMHGRDGTVNAPVEDALRAA